MGETWTLIEHEQSGFVMVPLHQAERELAALRAQLAAKDAEAAELRASLQAAIQRAEMAEILAKPLFSRRKLESALAAARKELEIADRGILSIYAGPSDLKFNNDADLADFQEARKAAFARAALERINGEGHAGGEA